MDKFELQKRLKNFAHRCFKLGDALPKNSIGKYFQSQLVRSAFSAAANYRAACIAQSRPPFVAKLSITFEEIDESSFWLENIIDIELIPKKRVQLLHQEAIELAKILAAGRKSSQ
jgi:four helix bundle protein